LLAACPNDSHGSADLDHIKVTSLPHLTTYTYSSNATFNSVGLEVTAFYTDGSREPVADYSLSWGDTDHTPFGDGTFPQAFAGSVETVVVTWNGKSDHFSITVNNANHTDIVATPSVTPSTGSYAFPLSVTLSTTTAGATIYYTTDGTDPSTTHNNGTPITTSGPVQLDGPATLKAVALKAGSNPSSQLVAHYLISTVKLPGMLPSTVEDQLFPLAVTLIPNTPGSDIYYTIDGSTPTKSSPQYSGAFTLSEPKTLKFKAFKDGMDPSGPAEVVFTAFTATESDLTGLSTRLAAAQAGAAASGTGISGPITLPVNMELSLENWMHLLEAIDGGSKYVALDLSACTASAALSGGGLSSNGTFDGIATLDTGKNKIVSLILPDAATTMGSLKLFSALKSVEGANVLSVGGWCSPEDSTLEKVSFPKATQIHDGAFWNCTGLKELYLPSVTQINWYFLGAQAGDSNGLTITLGATAPTLGTAIFSSTETPKAVTIRIPSNATGYGTAPTDTTTSNWANGFRGGGWNGSSMGSGTVVGNVTLTFETYPE
jgi:hypothetical protein